MFRGKKYKESAKQIDKTMLYEAADGMALICKTASAKEQLSKLEGWAKAAKVDSLSTNLLYTQANYYYTFGMNAQGDQAFKHLVEQYAQQADYDKAEACYQELIGMSRRSGNTSMMARAYSNYMAWHDSIANIKAQQAYNALKAQYDSSLQTIGEKDDALAARRYTIVGLCILAAILAGALVLGGIVLLRFIALNRNGFDLYFENYSEGDINVYDYGLRPPRRRFEIEEHPLFSQGDQWS